MSYPKWKYRKHPTDGFFQSTFVLTAEAEADLDPDWSDDPTVTGFAIRPVTQLHISHAGAGIQYRAAGPATGPATEASIDIIVRGDIRG